MKIRNSTKEDLDQLMKIYKSARAFMKEHGNPNQWGDTYPSRTLIEEDIALGQSYICEDDGKIVGTFIYFEGDDPDYDIIEDGDWLDDQPYAVMHRVSSILGKKGVASFCINWCYQKFPNIKIDTHEDNIPMQNLLNKLGFKKCGIIYTSEGSRRLGYQKR